MANNMPKVSMRVTAWKIAHRDSSYKAAKSFVILLRTILEISLSEIARPRERCRIDENRGRALLSRAKRAQKDAAEALIHNMSHNMKREGVTMSLVHGSAGRTAHGAAECAPVHEERSAAAGRKASARRLRNAPEMLERCAPRRARWRVGLSHAGGIWRRGPKPARAAWSPKRLRAVAWGPTCLRAARSAPTRQCRATGHALSDRTLLDTRGKERKEVLRRDQRASAVRIRRGPSARARKAR